MVRFSYYLHDQPLAFRIELSGSLTASNAPELERCWRTAASALGERSLIVEISSLASVDETGRGLLSRWQRQGARFIAESAEARAILVSIAEPAELQRKAANY
jgi:anti-anti-sigma regulatory factor